MSWTAAIYGRLGRDPRELATRKGSTMAACSIAIDVERDGDARPEWLSLIAFGSQAEMLLKHAKGELLGASGRIQRKRWTDKEGNEREQLELVADLVISARAIRPGGGKKRTSGTKATAAEHDRPLPLQQPSADADLDDSVPF